MLTPEKSKKIIEEARKNVARWYDYWAENIEQFKLDREFFSGDQWEPREVAMYQSRNIEPLVHNLIKPIGRQIIGESKNMQPALNLTPTNAESVKPKDIKLMQGLLRQIAYSSTSSVVYSTTLQNQIAGGWGVIGVKTEYESEDSMQQRIVLRRFAQPENVGFDPLAEEKDKTDGDFTFCWEVIEKEDFERKYPGVEPIVGAGILGSARTYINFLKSDGVVVLEYYRREKKRKTLVELTNGTNFKIEVFKADIEAAKEQYLQMMTQSGVPLFQVPPLEESNRRKTTISQIRCYKLTSQEILEEYDWQAKRLPFSFVDCMSTYRDSKQYTESFIFAAREPQRVYNYAMTNIVAGINRLRRTTTFMTPKMMKGFEAIYKNPDRQNGAYPFNPDPALPNGPIIVPPEQISQNYFELAQAAKEDVQRTLGVFDASRGELPNDSSGVAIGRTIIQSNLSLVQLWQNLFDGMQSVGKTVLELIPKIYDNERIVSIVDETGQQQNVTLNQVQQGGQVNNDISDAAYKLEVKPVAAFAIQNQLVSDFMAKIAQVVPGAAPLIADLMGSTLEHPVVALLVQRLRTLLPPDIAAKEQGLPPPPPQPNPQMQMMQMQMKELMAKIGKIEAETQAIQQKSGLEQFQHQTDTALELNKQQIDKDKLIADTVKTHMQTSAEIKKAYLDSHTKIHTKTMDVLRSAQPRASVH